MALNEKKLQRLDQLLAAFDTGAVQPDELIKAVDAVIAIIDANGKSLVDQLMKHKSINEKDLQGLKSDLKQAKTNLERVISDVQSTSSTNVDKVRANLLAEIKRVELLIPELPPETDLTDVFSEFEAQREELTRLSTLVLGENLRNALESLTGDDRLDVSAIRGLEKLLEDNKSVGTGKTAAGVRLLRFLADVDIDGITDGQTLVWDESVGQFIPGSGGGSSLPDQTGNNGKFLTTDGTDPSWEAIPGGGDMLRATYDPANKAEQVLTVGDIGDFATAAQGVLADSAQQPPTEGPFVDGDKTKLDGIEVNADVTDTTNVAAAGALMDSEVENLAAVKAFDPADYATASQGDLADSALQNIVEDTTPQLGGNLDAQGNDISDLGDVTFQTGAGGGTLRTGTAVNDKFELLAYDTALAEYRKVLEVDAGASPRLEVFSDSFAIWDTADESKRLTFGLLGGATGVTTGLAFAPTANRIILFPDATTVLVGNNTTDTLTNKTLTSPTITTPTGIVKGDVGLGNVDNTSDANKPVSTAQQTALDLKQTITDAYILTSEASSATPTITGTALRNDYVATALATNTILAAPSGTANANAVLRYRLTSTGTYTVGYNAGLLAGNITRTTSLAAGETLTQVYQRVGSTWVCVFEDVTS